MARVCIFLFWKVFVGNVVVFVAVTMVLVILLVMVSFPVVGRELFVLMVGLALMLLVNLILL